jgi:hypothetical protein
VTLRYELRQIELLTALLDEMRAVRRLLEEARRPEPGEARYAELVRAIAATARERVFSSAELIQHAEVATELRAAIVSAIGSLNARKLGRALRRVEGTDIAGLVVARVGADSGGVSWRIRVSGAQNPETRAVGFA